ncbi:MAG: hypothetical protein MHM6MM_001166 [Cercozoa sp. M6MM]
MQRPVALLALPALAAVASVSSTSVVEFFDKRGNLVNTFDACGASKNTCVNFDATAKAYRVNIPAGVQLEITIPRTLTWPVKNCRFGVNTRNYGDLEHDVEVSLSRRQRGQYFFLHVTDRSESLCENHDVQKQVILRPVPLRSHGADVPEIKTNACCFVPDECMSKNDLRVASGSKPLATTVGACTFGSVNVPEGVTASFHRLSTFTRWTMRSCGRRSPSFQIEGPTEGAVDIWKDAGSVCAVKFSFDSRAVCGSGLTPRRIELSDKPTKVRETFDVPIIQKLSLKLDWSRTSVFLKHVDCAHDLGYDWKPLPDTEGVANALDDTEDASLRPVDPEAVLELLKPHIVESIPTGVTIHLGVDLKLTDFALRLSRMFVNLPSCRVNSEAMTVSAMARIKYRVVPRLRQQLCQVQLIDVDDLVDPGRCPINRRVLRPLLLHIANEQIVKNDVCGRIDEIIRDKSPFGQALAFE